MNKFAIGCLITLGIVVVGGGAAAYFLVIKPASEFVGGVMEFATDFEELNQQIDEKDPYSAGPNATVGTEQFQRFLAAQETMKGQLQGRMDVLEAKYQQMEDEMNSENREMNIAEVADVYRDIGELILEAKRAQVAALNAQDFSLDEYTWVRDQVYKAIGASVGVASLTATGQVTTFTDVDEETVQMVTPHREALMESYALAWFGL